MLPPRRQPSLIDPLEHELAQERASALGRLGRALESALAALAEHDVAHPQAAAMEIRQQRAVLIERASVALWHFVVQREACGLRDIRYVLRDYRVPPEVAVRMGVLPSTPGRRPPRS
jgi:hypothetical protein